MEEIEKSTVKDEQAADDLLAEASVMLSVENEKNEQDDDDADLISQAQSFLLDDQTPEKPAEQPRQNKMAEEATIMAAVTP